MQTCKVIALTAGLCAGVHLSAGAESSLDNDSLAADDAGDDDDLGHLDESEKGSSEQLTPSAATEVLAFLGYLHHLWRCKRIFRSNDCTKSNFEQEYSQIPRESSSTAISTYLAAIHTDQLSILDRTTTFSYKKWCLLRTSALPLLLLLPN